MPDDNKPSTLGDQIKSAQESVRSWPDWLRDAAKVSGQPAPSQQPHEHSDRAAKKD
jgi:hypothetical protein